jgi:hypothetical protein
MSARSVILPASSTPTAALSLSWSTSQAAAGFATSPEFQVKYGPLDDAGYVTQLYRNVLHRDPEPTGLQSWLNTLSARTSRADVLLGFSESAENVSRTIGTIDDELWLRDD